MFILSNFLTAVAGVIGLLLTVAYWLILIRALISWVSPDPYNPIVRFLYQTTEPILEPIRRRLPAMAVDVSPIVAFFGVVFLQRFLVQTLLDVAFHLR